MGWQTLWGQPTLRPQGHRRGPGAGGVARRLPGRGSGGGWGQRADGGIGSRRPLVDQRTLHSDADKRAREGLTPGEVEAREGW